MMKAFWIKRGDRTLVRFKTIAGISLLCVVGGAAIAQIVALPLWTEGFPFAENNPYRYPFSAQLSGSRKPVLVLQQEIAFYQHRVHIDPQGGLNLTALAQTYVRMGKALGEVSWYLLAEQAAERSLVNLPFNNTGALLVLAHVREAEHQFQTALTLTDQVLKERPDDSDALAIRVTCHLATGQYQLAATEAEQIVKQGRSIGSLTLLALAQANLGQDQTAIQQFQAAIHLEEPGELGSSAWARTLLGRLYAQRGHLDQAQQLFQEARRIIPRYPLALIQEADLNLRLGHPQAAEQLYNQVIADSTQGATIYDHVVLRGLARTHLAQNDRKTAQSFYDRAEKALRQQWGGHAGGSFGHRRELAQLLLERGHPEDLGEALRLMQDEIQIRRDTETLDTLAWAYMRSQRPQSARQVLQTVVDRGTRDAVVFYRIGVLEQQLGHTDKAHQWFQRSKGTDPTLNATTLKFVGL